MELILLRDVDQVGRKGDLVKVRDGFGRNFLIPRGLALAATRSNQQFVEEQKVRAATRREKEQALAQGKAEKLQNLRLTVEAKAGEQDKLYGSVTAEDIREALKKQGYDFDKKQIRLEESIRSLGTWTVEVEIYPQVKAAVTVEVVRAKS